MNTASIKLLRQWDSVLLQTADSVPSHSVAVLLDFTIEPAFEGGGLPPTVAHALAKGLTNYGIVAGRWLDDAPAATDHVVLWEPQQQSLLERFAGRMRNSWAVPIVTTRSPKVVFDLLNQGWSMQDQALLIFSPEDISPAQAVHALSVNRDWKAFTFPPPARVLIVPGVDGDFILIAAAAEEWLTSLMTRLARAFRAPTL